MKFRNTKEVPLAFVFHGQPHTVAPKGEWECPARLAFAVSAMGLPLAPEGDVEEAMLAEQPQSTGAFRDSVASFVNTSESALRFRFHGAEHAVGVGARWECPERLAFAVEATGLPLKRVPDEPAVEAPKAKPALVHTKASAPPAPIAADVKVDEPAVEAPKGARPKG